MAQKGTPAISTFNVMLIYKVKYMFQSYIRQFNCYAMFVSVIIIKYKCKGLPNVDGYDLKSLTMIVFYVNLQVILCFGTWASRLMCTLHQKYVRTPFQWELSGMKEKSSMCTTFVTSPEKT